MILCFDIGGTSIQYALFDSGEPEWIKATPTEVDFTGQIKRIITSVLAESSAPIELLAVGVPGPTSGYVMQGSKPLNCNRDIDFSRLLAEFKLPVLVANDLKMAMYCEMYSGVGARFKNYCLLSLSTGIGVAVVNDGRLVTGRTEMGHQVIAPNLTPPQVCINHNNCWASLASGAAIEQRFSNAQYTTAEEIFSHVLVEQDLLGLQKINAQGLGGLVNAYDPEVIVVMGSLGVKQFEKIIPPAAMIEAFTINRPVPPIIKTGFGHNIGVLGAYYAGREYCSA